MWCKDVHCVGNSKHIKKPYNYHARIWLFGKNLVTLHFVCGKCGFLPRTNPQNDFEIK